MFKKTHFPMKKHVFSFLKENLKLPQNSVIFFLLALLEGTVSWGLQVSQFKV